VKFIYCQSYQAFNLALYYNLQEEITVISSSRNIINACEFLIVNCLSHQHFSLNDLVSKRSEVNIELEKLIQIINGNEFHFSHTQFAVFCFILVKKLNDLSHKTVFHNFEFVYGDAPVSSFLHKNYLYHLTYKILLQERYRLPIEVRMSAANSYMLGLNLKYISKNCYRIEDDKLTYYDLTLNLFRNISIGSFDIERLFIGQTFTNSDFFDIEKVETLLPILNSPSIALKNHPKLGKVEGLSNCRELPDYIPVEFFFKNVRKCIISFHSASLITASRFENIKVISLLKLVGVKNDFYNSIIDDLDLKSKGKIIFPETIEEFQSYL